MCGSTSVSGERPTQIVQGPAGHTTFFVERVLCRAVPSHDGSFSLSRLFRRLSCPMIRCGEMSPTPLLPNG